tara:strand:- start:18788 stop:18988 length:201 start_codon:yes stop_codon:yes gene_type:complete
MNILTKKIKNKGYSLDEFCDANLISLRTYRRWEKEDNKNHNLLVGMVGALSVSKEALIECSNKFGE